MLVRGLLSSWSLYLIEEVLFTLCFEPNSTVTLKLKRISTKIIIIHNHYPKTQKKTQVNSQSLDEFAVEQQLPRAELNHGDGQVVVVDHPQSVIAYAPARVGLDSGGLARLLPADEAGQRPAGGEAQAERLGGRRGGRGDGDEADDD